MNDSYHFASVAFPSGAVLQLAGGQIVGREEPGHEQHIGNRLMTTEEVHAGLRSVLDALRAQDAMPEPIRPALTWNTATPFDSFAGFTVSADSFNRVESSLAGSGFASPDLQATTPLCGSADLLLLKTA